jgi:putative transposase
MDFMSDALADGRKLRVLTVIDLFTRESLAIRVDSRFTSGQVAVALTVDQSNPHYRPDRTVYF